MLPPDCVVKSVEPYVPTAEKPWTTRRVAHLYKRLGYGATPAQLQTGLAMSPSGLVDQLLDEAANLPSPAPPIWANYTSADYEGTGDLAYQHYSELRRRWLLEMVTEGIRSKMAFFWHNHFVTEKGVYGCNSYMWAYFKLLHDYAFGNFRTFVEEMGKNPAMLDYLDGNKNTAAKPNENYSRELMELFTMGESNGYTQDDIVGVARALTGWVADNKECTPAYFDPDRFDPGEKTIFGQTGNWNYDDVHELIFTQRQDETAHYICSKLYKFFIYNDVDEDVVNALAITFKANNWELVPVLKQIFKSEHFFEEALLDTKIKSPVDCFIPILASTAMEHPTDYTDSLLNGIISWVRLLGQDLFNPIDVAGWPGHRAWINENMMTFRWSFVTSALGRLTSAGRDKLVVLAIDLTNTSNDPAVITQALAEHFIGRPLEPNALAIAELTFRGDIPSNYYDEGSWNLYWDEAPWQILNLLNYLIRLPEFQLT